MMLRINVDELYLKVDKVAEEVKSKEITGESKKRIVQSLEKTFKSMKNLHSFLKTNADEITNAAEQTCKVLSYAPFVGMAFAVIVPIVKTINDNSAVDNGIASTIGRLDTLMSSVLKADIIDQSEVSSFLKDMMNHYIKIGKLKRDRNRKGKLTRLWGAQCKLGELEGLDKTIDNYLSNKTLAIAMENRADTKKILNIVETNNPHPVEVEKETIDAYFAMQFPSASLDNIDGRPWFHSELENVKQYIAEEAGEHTFQDLENKGFECFLSDGNTLRLQDNIDSIRLLVWCSMGHNEAAINQDELYPNPKMFKDAERLEIAVVIMEFGAEYVASQLIKAGVPRVLWIQKDPYKEKELKILFQRTLLPICKEFALGKDVARFDKNHYGVENIGFVEDGDHIQKQFPKKPKKGLTVKLVQTKHCVTSSWLQSKNLITLKMDVCDLKKMGNLEETITDYLENNASNVFFITPDDLTCGNKSLRRAYERSRALSLSVCNKIAAKEEIRMHRFACEKRLHKFMDRENQSWGKKMLIWIDIDRKKFELSESQIMENIRIMATDEDVTIIVLVSNDYSQTDVKAKTNLPSLRENQWIDVDNMPSHSNIFINSTSLNVEIPVSNLRGNIQIKEVTASIELTELGAAFKKFLQSCNGGLNSTIGIDVEIFRLDNKSLMIRVSVMDIKFLATLRDKILIEDNEVKLKLSENLGSAKSKKDIMDIQFDASSVATMYEELMVQFDVLTDHQREALEKCAKEKRVRIEGPAGTGKTFIALHSILEFFHKTTNAKDSKNVLFICRNLSLAFYFANWLHNRWANQKENTDTVLQHLFFINHVKEDAEPIICSFNIKNESELDYKQVTNEVVFETIVVDEAHNVFLQEKMKTFTSDIINKNDDCKVMFLSDVSQATGTNIEYPGNYKEVKLSEICRSSKRIVSGAFPFQLGTGEVKNAMRCLHDSDGPPLRPFLFSCDDSMNEFEMYERNIKSAIGALMERFPGLNLHDRLAIVVPNEDFRKNLCKQLLLGNETYYEADGKKLQIKRALEASKILKFYKREQTKKSWIIVDEVDQFEGLERLIVFGVGLDEDLNRQDVNASAVRSRIYRTITRAHMVFYLINKRVPGGWFEFLDGVKSNTDGKFDYHKEISVYDSAAAHHSVEAANASKAAARLYGFRGQEETQSNDDNKTTQDMVVEESHNIEIEETTESDKHDQDDYDREESTQGKKVSSFVTGTWQINDENRAEESTEKRFNPFKVVGEEAENTKDDIKDQLDMFKIATMNTMRGLIGGHGFAPAMMIFYPQKKTYKGIKPVDWFKGIVKVMFVCPVTMRVPKDIDGTLLHYTIKLPNDWVKTLGPTILLSLNVLKIACGFGKVAGIAPLVLKSMYDELKNVSELKPTHKFIEEMYKKPDELNRAKSLKETHGAIAVSKLFQPQDYRFQHSGLVLATDTYGVSEYIHKDIKLVVEEYGFEQCLTMSTVDLDGNKRKLQEEAEKKEQEHERLFKERKEKNEAVDSSDILAKGYMQKKGVSGISIVSRFNERYFILKTDGALYYYMSESDAQKGNDAFYGLKRLVKVEKVHHTNDMKFTFENSNGEPPIIQMFRIIPNRNDDNDCHKWIEAAKKITRA